MTRTPLNRSVAVVIMTSIMLTLALPASSAEVLELNCPQRLADLTLKSEERPVYGPENFNLTCHYDPPPSDYGQGSHYLVFVWIVALNPRLPQNYGCEPTSSSYVESQTHKAEVLVVGDRFSSSPYPESIDAAKKAIDAALAKMETVALPCGAATPSPTTSTAECIPEGTVTDHRGRPVPGIHVRLEFGSTIEDIATDDQGRFRFGGVDPGGDPTSSGVVLSVRAEDWPGQRFRINHDAVLGRVSTDPIKPGDPCARDFAAASLPDRYVSSDPGRDKWASMIEVYQNVRAGVSLADQLGITISSTVEVYAWCKNASSACPARQAEAGSEFGVVNVNAADDPFIGLGDGASSIGAVNKPDNLEYHEFGHVAMTIAYRAFPKVKQTHGGYGEFDSAGSFLEGWADFYAAMVAKHIEGRAFPELYRQGGGYWNLETNYPPWGLGGTTEEYAVAGLLLDLEDGDADYSTARPEKQYTVTCCVSASNSALVGGSVTYTQTPTDPSAAEATVVVVTFSDGTTATVPVDPPRLAPGQQGTFAAPLPAGANASATKARVIEGRPGSILVDDERVDLDLKDLWSAIVGHAGRDRRAGQHVITIADLYEAVAGFKGKDADGDSIDDIDNLFLLHGLFADENGNQQHDPGEQTGLTSHPQAASYTGRPSRRNAPPLPETMAKADTQEVPSRVQVQVSFAAPNQARAYGYTAARDPSGSVMVAVPPKGSGATVTLIAFADGYEPALLGTTAADTYWDETEKHRGESFLAFEATMVAVAPAATGGGFPLVLLLGAGVVVVAAAIALLRRRPRVARAPAVSLCPSCATPLSGTSFCVSCGARLAP